MSITFRIWSLWNNVQLKWRVNFSFKTFTVPLFVCWKIMGKQSFGKIPRFVWLTFKELLFEAVKLFDDKIMVKLLTAHWCCSLLKVFRCLYKLLNVDFKILTMGVVSIYLYLQIINLPKRMQYYTEDWCHRPSRITRYTTAYIIWTRISLR